MSADVRRRMLQLAASIYQGEKITSRLIRERFGVSPATAKRDLVVLEATLPLRVTRIPDHNRPEKKVLAFELLTVGSGD